MTRPAVVAALMRAAIDYAGLFPPAALDMAGAVERYARYRRGPDAWALGRFVVPVARLGELEAAVAALDPAARGAGAWRLNALAVPPLGPAFAAVSAFNQAGAGRSAWPARIESIDVKVSSRDEIGQVPAAPDIERYVECPVDDGLEDLLDAAAAAGVRAKVRTGGTTPDAIPPPAAVGRFLAACARRRLPVKATAGLHHAFRSIRPLTDEPAARTAMMHGFLNVLVAAALADAHGLDDDRVTEVLEESSPREFAFSDDAITWRGLRVGPAHLGASSRLGRSFGSCSFEEPLDDLRALGLL
jgi:hypothetical protein